jgi:hypothetical protein
LTGSGPQTHGGAVGPAFAGPAGDEMSQSSRRTILLVVALTAAAAATASETISYSYDSRGRLVRVARTGTVNNNVSADYSYDKADNRTNVNVTSPNAPPP